MGFTGDKFPKEYNPKIIQQIYEQLQKKFVTGDKAKDKAIKDLSEELGGKLTATESRLAKKIAGKDEMGAPPRTIPSPKSLTVSDWGLFGFATVDAVQRWKYFGKIRGYEFYGSHNIGFTPQADPYNQGGYHFGGELSVYASNSDVLYTYESDSNRFIFDNLGALVGLTLENVTQGTSGTIGLESILEGYYKLRVTGVTWDKGDRWRIRKYPANRLWAFDALAFFLKYADCSYWVKARTEGTGKSFSAFTSATSSAGATFDIDTIEITAKKSAIFWDIGGNAKQWVTLSYETLPDEYGIIFYDTKLNKDT